jgi:hypothetical protein
MRGEEARTRPLAHAHRLVDVVEVGDESVMKLDTTALFGDSGIILEFIEAT